MADSKRWSAATLLIAVLAIPVAACDSASDGAVVTSQAAAGAAGSGADEPVPANRVGPPQGNQNRGRGTDRLPAQPTEVGDEDTALLLMREEEKLARDIYLALGDAWGLEIFKNIAASEQRHMDAVLELLDHRGIEDPVGDNPRGTFTDPGLQALHDDLLERGSESSADALLVGATIEDLDIRDLRAALDATADAEVARVLGNLERASLNHLRAFSNQIDKIGLAYTPQYMESAEYREVLAAGAGSGGGSQRASGNRGPRYGSG